MAVMKTFCGCLVTKTGAMTVLVAWAVSRVAVQLFKRGLNSLFVTLS